MNTKSVAFGDVKLGDRIYHADYYFRDKWRAVTVIKRTGTTVSLGMGPAAHPVIDTRTYVVGHKEEGIMIQE